MIRIHRNATGRGTIRSPRALPFACAPVRGAVLNDLDPARAGFGYYGMEEERQNGRRNGKDH
jgi:hypothetical protein